MEIMQKFTRREFYDLIWSKPITKIAVDLCVSDVAVHKICAKQDIPMSARGHWAKTEHNIDSLRVSISRDLGQFISRALPSHAIWRDWPVLA